METQPNITTNNLSDDVVETRGAISDAIINPGTKLISLIGPCPLVDEPKIIQEEAIMKSKLGYELNNLISLDRQCFTKPRTNPADWQGLDSSDPSAVVRIIDDLSKNHSNVTAEVRFRNNLERYAANLVMIWTGARNIEDDSLMHLIAHYDHSLPVGIKNGLDGEIDTALEQVNYINEQRNHSGAPAVLIYRGGENATNPSKSADMYKKAWDMTEGRIIRDNAHGLEMAHSPNSEFKKSVEGQIAAAEAAIDLARAGYPPLGVMYEASRLESIMDPHMPLETAMDNVRQLYSIKLGSFVNKSQVKLSTTNNKNGIEPAFA